MHARSNLTFTPNFWIQNSAWNEFASCSTTSITKTNSYGPVGLLATHTGSKSIEFPLKDHLGSPRVVVKQTIANGGVSALSVAGRYVASLWWTDGSAGQRRTSVWVYRAGDGLRGRSAQFPRSPVHR